MGKKQKKRRYGKPINLSHITPKEIIKTMLEIPPLPKKTKKK